MYPAIHAILSFFIPGLGQVVSREYLRGILVFVIAMIINGTTLFVFKKVSMIPQIIAIIYALVAAFDAYNVEKNKQA